MPPFGSDDRYQLTLYMAAAFLVAYVGYKVVSWALGG